MSGNTVMSSTLTQKDRLTELEIRYTKMKLLLNVDVIYDKYAATTQTKPTNIGCE